MRFLAPTPALPAPVTSSSASPFSLPGFAFGFTSTSTSPSSTLGFWVVDEVKLETEADRASTTGFSGEERNRGSFELVGAGMPE